jgi:hypothetical protein
VRAALAGGIAVSIVTGRLYSGTRAAAGVLGLRGAVGCVDGSHVVQTCDHVTLLHRGITGGDALTLREALAEARAATFVFAKDAIGHDTSGLPYIGYVSTWSSDIRCATDVFEHALWRADEGVTAVVALGEHDAVTRVAQRLTRALPEAVFVVNFPLRRGPHAGMWAIMVRAAGGTKGTAVRWIAEHEGVALENTVCVGDWTNDIPMFEVVGRSFAMGQAPEEVKSKATDILAETSAEGGGVARAIAEAYGIKTI